MDYKIGDIVSATIGASFTGRLKMGHLCTVEIMDGDQGNYRVKLLDTGNDAWPEEGYAYVTSGKDGWFVFHGLTTRPTQEGPSCL